MRVRRILAALAAVAVLTGSVALAATAGQPEGGGSAAVEAGGSAGGHDDGASGGGAAVGLSRTARAASARGEAAAKRRRTGRKGAGRRRAARKPKPCRARKRGNLYRSPGYPGVCKSPRTNPAPPLPPVVLGTGHDPEVAVDAAGTAHVVWSEDGGNAPDVLRYCRLKRAAKGCDNPPATRGLIPTQPGEPAFNEDFNGPVVAVVGEDLAVITHRYPNVVDKPDGASSRTTYMWISRDGGNSFSGPAIVGDGEVNGVATVFGTPDAPRIGLISDTKTGGTFFQSIRPGVYNGAEANLGGGGPDRAYSGSLATVAGRPIAAFNDLAGRTYIRQWNGAGSPEDPGQWSETSIAGDQPRLAAGPGGAYLVSRPRPGSGPLQVRRLNGITPGPAVDVGTEGLEFQVARRDITVDPGGDVRLAWVAHGEPNRLLERSSSDGTRFGPARVLARSSAAIEQVDLGATADGGGFALYTTGGQAAGSGTITASPFGNQAATGLAGLGALAGGGLEPGTAIDCQEVTFGAVRMVSQEGGCLLTAPGRPGVVVSEGTLKLNGLEIVPDAGVKILVGARQRTIDTTGTVTVQLRAGGGPIVLFRGELHIRLPSAGAGVRLASFDTKRFGVDIKGFPVSGDIDVFLERDSVRIPISLKLPKAFGGITGETTLRADNRRGLHVDSVRFAADQILLSPLEVDDLEASWNGSSDTWAGGGSVTVAGAGLELRVRFERGAFREGFVRVAPVPFPGVKLFPDVFLNSVSGRLGIDPTFIEAGVLVGAQPIAPPATYVIAIDARLRVTITPALALTFTGEGRLAGFPLADARLHADADGYVSARANARIDLAGIVSAGGGFDGFFDTARGQFGAGMRMSGCIGEPPFGLCSGFDAVVSSVGIGGCASGVIGFGYKWRGGGELLGPPSCDLGPYEVKARPAGARAAQAPQGFTLRGGLPSAAVRVAGAAGAPTVVLVSPRGERLTPVPLSDPAAASAPAVVARSGATATVGLRRPIGGGWTVEPQGGAAIASVAVANGLAPPRFSARVGGKGRKRVLRYRVTPQPGLTVRFFERVAGGARTIGVAKGARGRLRFSAGDGPGGRRRIVAIAERGGIPRLQRTVASYRAPGPVRPPRPRGLRVRRAGGGVAVSWRGARGAATYAVRVSVSDGRTLLRIVGGRRVKVSGIGRGDAVRVTVAGRSTAGRAGKPARAKLRARR
ncbi:MAG: hypothetical protein GXY03_04000 [Solirubrobacterales bacterium]|nr:hypothetical protein [Solirubrobacterales bacterium]